LCARLSIPETKIKVFPNGIDPVRFHRRNRQAMRRKHALSPEDFLVIFVGAFDERKGSQRVHQALAGLPSVRGIFVGEGPLRPSGEQVAFCGRAHHEEVAELLCAADLFVLPSREEGCSNATLEAMACGLPMVVSRRPFNAAICDQKSAWLVEPDDITEIRQAILQLKENPERRRRLGDAAFVRCARFDIRDRARNVLAWMQERIAAGDSSVREPADPASQPAPVNHASGPN
jgi:glycosyltransferase involved in cell wall biosynthesis